MEWAASHTHSRTTDEKELPGIQKITAFALDKCFMPEIEFLQPPVFLMRDRRDQAFTLTAGWSCFSRGWAPGIKRLDHYGLTGKCK